MIIDDRAEDRVDVEVDRVNVDEDREKDRERDRPWPTVDGPNARSHQDSSRFTHDHVFPVALLSHCCCYYFACEQTLHAFYGLLCVQLLLTNQ